MREFNCYVGVLLILLVWVENDVTKDSSTSPKRIRTRNRGKKNFNQTSCEVLRSSICSFTLAIGHPFCFRVSLLFFTQNQWEWKGPQVDCNVVERQETSRRRTYNVRTSKGDSKTIKDPTSSVEWATLSSSYPHFIVPDPTGVTGGSGRSLAKETRGKKGSHSLPRLRQDTPHFLHKITIRLP